MLADAKVWEHYLQEQGKDISDYPVLVEALAHVEKQPIKSQSSTTEELGPSL